MTNLFELTPAITETDGIIINNVQGSRHTNKCKHVLKSKKNTLKHKCNKALKRKLKQYKLRPDGNEDQDILDVSNILVNSLTIKSPGSKDNQLVNQSFMSDRPKNYLFRMVRNKQSNNTKGNSSNAINSNESNILSFDGSQEKKQTNAFKLLMDSRNKSIGTNSPGKEKTIEENLDEDRIEKKKTKAKRILVLQRMSEAKGSLKKREIEECQDKYIQEEIKKRADNFKNMLIKQELKSNEKKASEKLRIKTVSKVENNNDSVKTKRENCKSKKNSLQFVSLFNDTQIEHDKVRAKKNKEVLTREDKEFLEKLSPSMKKTENMLCYVMKIEKEPEPSAIEEDVVIKVKLPSKIIREGKNKKKKQTISNSELCNENSTQNIINPSSDLSASPIGRHKRKRNCGVHKQEVTPDAIHSLEDTTNRPKRTLKKPVKYNDDILLSSSDEELHIFTPKKKKHTNNTLVCQIPPPILKIKTTNSTDSTENKHKVKKKSELSELKNIIKLAPIFNSKQRLDTVTLEAKQKFLQSGVPEKLKKIIAHHKNNIIGEIFFPTVVHIQQESSIDTITYPTFNIPFVHIDPEINSKFQHHTNYFTQLLDLSCKKPRENRSGLQSHIDVKEKLQCMKQLRPKFPVYRTYRLLRDKKKGQFRGLNYLDLDNSVEVNNSVLETISESPEQLNWTDKYKAMSTNQIIGNFETVKELKKWLVLWTETDQKSRNNVIANSDSSDFYHSDTDSHDSSVKNVNNLLVITGPTGSGKTSSVYAVAADLAIKVIEVNASNKRTGKIMLQDLQEATQSHKVTRGAINTDSISKSQEIIQIETTKKSKKRGRPKKNIEKFTKKNSDKVPKCDTVSDSSGNQDITRTDMSLILIDDADIIFEQDDGFCSAIAQLVYSSKRPVILVTSSLSCSHLQRFLQNGKILKMKPLSPFMLGTWLDIMCLVDSGTCSVGAGSRFLNYFNGDVRKTINCLQFYASSQSQSSVIDEISLQVYSDTNKLNIDDEKSNMSWVDQENNEERNLVPSNILNVEADYLWDNYVQFQFRLTQIKFPLDTFNIWWSLPQALSLDDHNKANSAKLESIANVMDCMSISDYYGSITPNYKLNITSDPWMSSEDDSVSQFEDMSIYRKSAEVCDEISYELINNSITNAQRTEKSNKFDINFPEMTIKRERDRIVSRHHNLTKYLNPSAVMDRRALALDYWTSCRTICRIEKTKADNYSKRNNRFCHYLKSLNILCKNESFDYLCDSMSMKNAMS